MKLILFSILSLCVFTFTGALQAEENVTDNSTGVQFPSTVSFQANGKDYQLDFTGSAVRKKFFVKVYVVGSYLQKGAAKPGMDPFEVIMQDDNAKQLTNKWVHDATIAQVQEGYNDAFKKALGDNIAKDQETINKFVQFFNQDVKKGDEHVLRWTPGGNIEVIINGKSAGTIANNPEFAKDVWSLWFGQTSPVDRNSLVSMIK